MALRFEKLHKHFVAEVSPVDLRRVHDPETLAEIRHGMDEHASWRFIQTQAMNNRVKVQVIAQRVLDGDLTP